MPAVRPSASDQTRAGCGTDVVDYVGAIVRNQVATLVGLCAWLLFVENLLLGDLANLNVGRFLPGAAAAAISGQEPDTPLLAPAVALVLLVLYAAAAATTGSLMTNRRDVT